MRKLLLALLLCLSPLPALSAAVAHLNTTSDTGNTPNSTTSFTPTAGDLMFVCAGVGASADASPTLTDSLGTVTFTLVKAVLKATSSDSGYCWIADVVTPSASARTLDLNTPNDAGTSTIIVVGEIDGVTRDGIDAIKQFTFRENVSVASDSIPDLTFSSSVLTGNPTILALFNGTNPFTIAPPTNWTELADVGVSAADVGLEYVRRNSGFTGTQVNWDPGTTATAWAGIGMEIDTSAASSPAAFDTPPSVSAETTSVYTLSYNADANSVTFFAMAKVKDASAPADCDAVEAGTGAVATASEAVTGGADTTDLTISGGDPFPLYDLYGCVEGAGGDSAVTALVDETLDVPSGRQYVVKSGSPGVGEEGMLDDASPASADGDYIDADTLVDSFSLGADAHALTVNANTTFVIDTAGDTSRQVFTRRFYDVSAADWSDADPVSYYVNDSSQTWVGLPAQEGEPDPWLIPVDETYTRPLDALWDDAEGDALTHNVTGLPTGLSEDGETITGTPTVCGADTDIVFESTSITTTTASESNTDITVGARVPEFDGDNEATFVAEIEALCSLVATAGTAVFSASVPEGEVVSSSPDAGTIVEPDTEVTYVLSLGEGVSNVERRAIYVLLDVSDLVQWVDYIPVSAVSGCRAGTYENDGCWAVEVLTSTTGLTAWVDYTPVFEVAQSANRWTYENDGWIPVDTLTP